MTILNIFFVASIFAIILFIGKSEHDTRIDTVKCTADGCHMNGFYVDENYNYIGVYDEKI